MVSDVVHLDTTISQRIKHGEEEKDDEDTISVSTASTDNCDGAVVLQDAEDKAPCFQNIEVTNSSDVHFGNKTYYQGPVTIKQILYTNRDGENNKLPQTNGIHHELPHLAINEKVIDSSSLNYGNYNDGYTTDGVHHINGHSKFPNGINHDHFETIRGSDERRISKNQWLLIGGGIFIVILLIITAVTLTLTLKGSNSSTSPIIFDNDAQGDVSIIDRSSWVATGPVRVLPLTLPVPNIIISETKSEDCTEKGACIKYVRYLQNHNIEGNKYSDIIHNFLIGGDGNVYYGRGWKAQPEIATNCNSASLSIAFIGSYSNKELSKNQIIAAKRLIRLGVLSDFISGDYEMVALSQILGGNEGTSKNLLEEIKKWPNYNPRDYSKDITERETFCKG